MDILCDMDGVIANFTSSAIDKIKEVFGIEMTREDFYIPDTSRLVWERLTPKQKEKYKTRKEIYKDICGEGFFLNLKPFPQAIEFIKKIVEKGHRICFLTKPLNWEFSAPEKVLWLKKHFGDMKYSVVMVDSMEAKGYMDANFIIDDDERVISIITRPIPILLRQPWNKHIRNRYAFEADNIPQVLAIIEAYEEVEENEGSDFCVSI